MSRAASTVPMCGSTGPEYFAHSAAASRSRASASRGSPVPPSPSVASAIFRVAGPQETGEERPTPRGSKVTTS